MKMNSPSTLDEVIFEFHTAVDVPTPSDIAHWTDKYPQFADEIRAHAVEMIDMEALAAGESLEMENAVVSLRPVAATSVPTVGGRTLREVIRANGMTLPDFADELEISPVIVSDVNTGRILADTVPAKFMRLAARRLVETFDELVATVAGPKEIPAVGMMKAKSGQVTGRPMTWEEAVQASDMDDERKAFWLSDEE
jgi:transcriptional regulator with XRE-family HTH domain